MPDLVIFDCDGVLIDSEIIFGRVLGECLIAAHLPITMDEAMVLGFGKNRITLTAEAEMEGTDITGLMHRIFERTEVPR